MVKQVATNYSSMQMIKTLFLLLHKNDTKFTFLQKIFYRKTEQVYNGYLYKYRSGYSKAWRRTN